MEDSTVFLQCECSSNEHQIIIHKDTIEDEYFPVAYCSIHLTTGGLLKRIKIVIKYIFGYKCRYGQWEEFIFKKEHASKLRDLAEFLEK